MPDNTVLITLNAIQALGLGFALGAIGQSARAVVGLKKTHDASTESETFKENFNGSELLVSLLIGGIAGTFAMMAFLSKNVEVTQQSIIMLLAAGYAGADFIEGFVTKNLSSATPAAANAATTAATTAATAATTPHTDNTPEAKI